MEFDNGEDLYWFESGIRDAVLLVDITATENQGNLEAN